MSCIKTAMGRRPVWITITEDFKPGDPAPSGYLDWHEWAKVQHKAGLRQKKCGSCSKWKYPQELSNEEIVSTAYTRGGQEVELRSPICLECAQGKG